MSLQDKTEAPTQRRRDDAREEGRVAKSPDLNSALGLLACLIIIKNGGGFIYQHMYTFVQHSLQNLNPRTLTVDAMPHMVSGWIVSVGMMCAPVMLGAAAVGVATNVLQTGLMFSPKALRPDFSRMDPFKGITNLCSSRSLVELGKSLLKVGIVSYVVYSFLRDEYPRLTDLAGLSPMALGCAVAGLCYGLMIRATGAIVIISLLDYGYQRYTFEQSLKMTKQEVKEDSKRSEGDPMIKSRIRQRQREMVRKRSMQDVKQASVVVVNPIHFAVALKYDSETMAAPIVVAKGQRLLAERIKEIAEENKVPIVENIPVARMLYKLVEIGHPIPEDLFQAVAEILAYVFRKSRKSRR